MGRNRRNAQRTQQDDDDIYSAPPIVSEFDNNSDDHLAAIDFAYDLDSPALVTREIHNLTNQQLLVEEEAPRNMHRDGPDLEDRAPLVSFSPAAPPSALHQRLEEDSHERSMAHTRSPVLAR